MLNPHAWLSGFWQNPPGITANHTTPCIPPDDRFFSPHIIEMIRFEDILNDRIGPRPRPISRVYIPQHCGKTKTCCDRLYRTIEFTVGRAEYGWQHTSVCLNLI